MHIPQLFHSIWIGPATIPAECERWRASWLALHPGWRHQLWTDENLPPLVNDLVFSECSSYAQRADVLRYEVVARHGGIYVDMDFECRRNLEPLLDGVRAFAAEEEPGRICNAIFGAEPEHPWLLDVIASLPESYSREGSIPDQTGPGLVTRVTPRHPGVRLFESGLFYPYSWREPHRGAEPFPDAYAVHHWTNSWADDEKALADRRMHELGMAIMNAVPAGARVAIIGDGLAPPIENRSVTWFWPEDWLPSEAQAALRLDQVRRDVDWVVVVDWSFWWLEHYEQLRQDLEGTSERIARHERFIGYRLA